jgi:cell division protein FtsA
MSDIYAAIEIGTTRTLLAVGEPAANGRLCVTCHAEIPSTGVRKSQILDINQATQSIKGVLHAIEKKQSEIGSDITIGNAFLVVSGQHIKADPFTGTIQVDGRVTDEDIMAVAEQARTIPLAKDRELLDIVEQDYSLDNLGGITAPKGMAGRVLKLNTLHIHADRNRIEDARTAANGARLEIREPLFAATCAGEAVLEEHERKNGVLVLDIGGGSTGYAVYSDGYLASSGVIGVGGDHVTNDIAHAFQTTQSQAESLKINEATAIIGKAVDGEASRVKLTSSSPLLDSRTISRRALDTVVNVRMRELFAVIRDILESQDLLHRLHSGVVITGGGSAMRDIATLAQHELGANVRIGHPLGIDGLENEANPAAFAAIAGALLYAYHTNAPKPLFGLNKLFGGLFK